MRSGLGSRVVSTSGVLEGIRDVGRQRAALQADGIDVVGIADAHEAARHHGPAVALLGEKDPQDERPRLQLAVAPHRHGGKPHRLLQHDIDAAILDRLQDAPPPQQPELAAEHPIAEGFARRLAGIRRGHHHVVELVAHRRAHRRIAEPPGGDVGHGERAPVDRLGEGREERQHAARLADAAAEPVRHHHLAVAHRLHQPGHAEPRARIELQRIGEIGVEPAQQHLGTLEAGNGADENAVVARREVRALDQQEAEIAGEVGVLEIGLVHRSRRQHADAGIVLAAKACEFRLQGLEERRVAVDMQVAVDVRNALPERQPVFEGEAGARRRLGAVAEHPPAAVGAARDVRGIKTQMRTAGRRHAHQRPQEFRAAGHERARQPVFTEQVAGAIDIGDHRLDQAGAFGKRRLQALPFVGRDDQRNGRQRPAALDAGLVLVDAIKHARIAQIAIGGGKPARQFLAPEGGKAGEQVVPMLAQLAVVTHHLVIDGRQRPVTRQQLGDEC